MQQDASTKNIAANRSQQNLPKTNARIFVRLQVKAEEVNATFRTKHEIHDRWRHHP
jgi:hypothetical protein